MLLSDCVLRHVVVTLMTKLHLNPLHYLLALAGLVGCPSDLCISLSARSYISFAHHESSASSCRPVISCM